jgi:hypothetical protein
MRAERGDHSLGITALTRGVHGNRGSDIGHGRARVCEVRHAGRPEPAIIWVHTWELSPSEP